MRWAAVVAGFVLASGAFGQTSGATDPNFYSIILDVANFAALPDCTGTTGSPPRNRNQHRYVLDENRARYQCRDEAGMFGWSLADAGGGAVSDGSEVVDGVTYSQDCAGIEACLTAVGTGGECVLMPVTYSPCLASIEVPFTNQTLRGVGLAIIDASGGQPATLVLDINGQDGFTLRGVEIRGDPSGGALNSLIGTSSIAHEFTCDGCTLRDSDRFGIVFFDTNARETKILHSVFSGSDNPLVLTGSLRAIIFDNDFGPGGGPVFLQATNQVTFLSNRSDSVAIPLAGAANRGLQVLANTIDGGTIEVAGTGVKIANNDITPPDALEEYCFNITALTDSVITSNTCRGNPLTQQLGLILLSSSFVNIDGTWSDLTLFGAAAVIELTASTNNIKVHDSDYSGNTGLFKVLDAGVNNRWEVVVGSDLGILTDTPSALIDLDPGALAPAVLELHGSFGCLKMEQVGGGFSYCTVTANSFTCSGTPC